eukprot:SAG31_NODE_32325_length_357_cov_0.806202_1_plen_54_part_10
MVSFAWQWTLNMEAPRRTSLVLVASCCASAASQNPVAMLSCMAGMNSLLALGRA